MTALDAHKIQQFQREGKRIAPDIRGSFQSGLRAVERIEELVSECGLDPLADESYELARADLSRKAFLEAKTLYNAFNVLDLYHAAQRLAHDRGAVNQQLASHYYQLEQLLEYGLPMFEAAVAEAGFPSGLSALEARELAFIRSLAADGSLNEELAHAANILAEDSLRTAYMYIKAVNPAESIHKNAVHARSGASYARLALELMDKAGAHFAPRDIPDAYGRMGGWSDTTIRYSRETAEDFRKQCTLIQCGSEFEQAKKFHDQGHYVLDASGSGHGMMVMPMQEIMKRLQENGFDIRDPKTFEGMGTDIDTVWTCYRTERAETLKGSQYTKLAGPELTR